MSTGWAEPSLTGEAGAAALLAATLVGVGWFVRPRPSPRDRRARYRRWMVRAGAAFLLPTLVVLALIGRVGALRRLPPEFGPARALLPAMATTDVTIGALAGTMLGMAAAAWRKRRGGGPIGRPGALMPRSRAELPWGAGVALIAGLTEEPFFRLLLPLLVALAGGGAAIGFVLSALIFAGLHGYQGWRGMLATGLFGLVMTALYLLSGALWLIVLLHVLADLNGLVLWPALSSSGASRSGRSR